MHATVASHRVALRATRSSFSRVISRIAPEYRSLAAEISSTRPRISLTSESVEDDGSVIDDDDPAEGAPTTPRAAMYF